MDADPRALEEAGSDELLGQEALITQRAQLDAEHAALQAEELEVSLAPPAEDEDGEAHQEPGPPPIDQEHDEYDPTPPADDDYAVPPERTP